MFLVLRVLGGFAALRASRVPKSRRSMALAPGLTFTGTMLLPYAERLNTRGDE
jgi:hypothetical protein